MADPLLPPLPPSDLVASGLFLRRKDAGWLLLRATKHGEWGFPKGHMDPGEDLIQTALRECVEECGIALVAIVGEPQMDHYQIPSGKRKTTVYYPAETSTIEVTLSTEHDRHRWCSAEEALELLSHPKLRTLFRAAVASWPA